MREQLVRLVFACFFVIIATTDLETTFQSLMDFASRVKRPQPGPGQDRTSPEKYSQKVQGPTGLPRFGNTELSTETRDLASLKEYWTEIMQEFCLPKLVCELHASVANSYSLTEAERGLLSVIRDTTLGTSAGIISKYHFAAHMGQLLHGVEGNGCHNIYPNCPISGSRVLQMVKRVKVK